jgi:hypothetical protein
MTMSVLSKETIVGTKEAETDADKPLSREPTNDLSEDKDDPLTEPATTDDDKPAERSEPKPQEQGEKNGTLEEMAPNNGHCTEPEDVSGEPEEEIEYPNNVKLALITTALCLAVFCMALVCFSMQCASG